MNNLNTYHLEDDYIIRDLEANDYRELDVSLTRFINRLTYCISSKRYELYKRGFIAFKVTTPNYSYICKVKLQKDLSFHLETLVTSIKDGVEESGTRKEVISGDDILQQCAKVRQHIVDTLDHKEFRSIHHRSIIDRLKDSFKSLKNRLFTKTKNTETKGDGIMTKTTKVLPLREVRELYKGLDESHGFDHIKKVIKNAIKLTEYVEKVQGRSVNKAVVQNAAALHDITSHCDRDNHNASGARESRKILKSKGIALTSDELDRIEVCIYEHRASYTGELSSLESEILSSADRNAPREIHEAYERSYKFALEKGLATDFDTACEHAHAHIIKKYAKGGYANFPKLYQEYYKEDIVWMENEIATLTLGRLKEKLKHMR